MRETEELYQAYMDAWNAGDLESIVAMHAANGSARSVVHGEDRLFGVAAIRAAWEGVLAAWPDMVYESTHRYVGEGYVIEEMVMSGTLGIELPAPGGGTYPPDGRRIRVPAVEITTWKDGFIQRKDTYFDSATLFAQLAEPVTPWESS